MRAVYWFFLVLIPISGWCEPRVFTDQDGRQITAEVARLSGTTVTFKINNKLIDFPVGKLSTEDQIFLQSWKPAPSQRGGGDPVAKSLLIQVWEEEGAALPRGAGRFQIGPDGRPVRIDPQPQVQYKPNTKTERESKHYRIDISNPTNSAALPVRIEYTLFKRDAEGNVRKERGKATSASIPAGERRSVKTNAISTSYEKTETRTTTTFYDQNGTYLGSTSDRNISRSKETFGGIWVRVFSGGEMIKEVKKLSADVAKTDPQF